MPSAFCLFIFETFDFGNSSFFLKTFSTFWYDTNKIKISCIPQRVITLLIQRTSGKENYSFSEFFYSFWTSRQLLSSSTTNQMLGTLDFKGSYKHWAPFICFLRAQPCIMMHTCNLCKPQPLSTNWTSLPSKESNPGWTITQTIEITLNGQTSWPSQILCCLINYKPYTIVNKENSVGH